MTDEKKVECGRGWTDRCARAKNPICRCRCRGINHGNPLALKSHERKERYQVPIIQFRNDKIGKIFGARIDGRPVVFYNGSWLDPAPSLAVVNHSPDGFEWGYAGSGCSQLALAIALKWLTKAEAITVYQLFKFEVVAKLPRDTFELDLENTKKILTKLVTL